MCKRNSPDKTKVNMGCVRETRQIKMKQQGMLKRDSADKKKKDKKKKHGICKRNSPD